MLDLFNDQYNRAYIYTPTLAQALEFEAQQIKFHWLASEMLVEQDKQTLLTGTTVAEKHAVLTVLKTFTHYEVRAGNSYWLGRILNTFAPIEIKRMATVFGYIENCVHAPFYDMINKALFVNDADFYNDYLKDPVLAEHMGYVDEAANADDLLLALATFSLIEGAVLYSAFAVLKSFRANGHNKMSAITNGVNFSERDEALHSAAGAWLYHVVRQYGKTGHRAANHPHHMFEHIVTKLVAHEDHIIDMIFEQGEFCSLTKADTQAWVRERVNHCLKQLQLEPMYTVNKSSISGWFGRESVGLTRTDFFDGIPKYKKGFPLEGFDFSDMVY